MDELALRKKLLFLLGSAFSIVLGQNLCDFADCLVKGRRMRVGRIDEMKMFYLCGGGMEEVSYPGLEARMVPQLFNEFFVYLGLPLFVRSAYDLLH